MLGLTQQVGGAEFPVDAVIGNDQGLGRAGEEIDADTAIELALGLRHEGVARADQHVDGTDRLGSDCHGRNGLDAAEHEDLVGAGKLHGRDDGRVRRPLVRRRRRGDVADAGDLGGDDAHMGGGHHRIFSARHIASDRADRDVLMAEHHAREGLDLHVLDGRALDRGEIADLSLGEADVLQIAWGDLCHGGVDLGLREDKTLRRPAIEFLRQVTDRRVAALLHVGEDLLDGSSHFRVSFGALDGALGRLEMAGHQNACPGALCGSHMHDCAPALWGICTPPSSDERCSPDGAPLFIE
jgi:hypothetical protein